MKVERDYLGKRYTFIPASKEDEKFLDVFNKYIDQLEEENKMLKKENNELKERIKNMEKAEKDFMYLMKKYILNKGNIIKLETLYDICFEGK